MLHPVVQPDSKLDYEYPPETVTVVFKAGAPLVVHCQAEVDVRRISDREVQFTTSPQQNQWLPLEIKLTTGTGEPTIDMSWFTAEDQRPRAFMLRRILLPFATPRTSEPPKSRELQLPEIAGGDWQRGKAIFFGEQAQCGKCHKISGEGHRIGPDLSNLIFRDYVSVMRDITEPNAAINPDHITYNVLLNDGRMKSGVLVTNSAEEIELGDSKGVISKIQKSEIEKLAPTSISSMPEGLLKPLDDSQRRDLLMFLLTAPTSGTGVSPALPRTSAAANPPEATPVK
jgi:putative heme-binding domain-containing protein